MQRSSVVLVLGIVACGGDDGHGHEDVVDCSTVTGVDTFVVGLEKAGGNGIFNFRMLSASPAPPARGDNTWIVQINALNAGVIGDPVENVELRVTPFMPAHQHGTAVPIEITPLADPGQYELSPVNLWMQGVWETTIRATVDTMIDSTVFKFCVD